MFIDYVGISVKAGDGGKGCVSFHREKFVIHGPPDGGDGGNGGNIYFIGNVNLNTLLDFTYKRIFEAENGKKGGVNRLTGRSGKSLEIEVPLGTVVKDKETDEVLCEILEEGEKVLFLKGGKGGKGNYHFKTSTKQAPKYAQPGIEGEKKELILELKILADVGLVGFPNAGKSTLLSVMSNARPKIADYPFTTLVPNLGIVKYGNFKSFVMADIPGLIEGAKEGKGLGTQFLRHIERTKVLIYMISSESDDVHRDYNILKNEVEGFSEVMKDKPQILVLTKSDLLTEESEIDLSFFNCRISSATNSGLEELKDLIGKVIKENF
ncbi:MAG: GTPase ObgE [Candidatus Delongbacteria bacterium]|nr:GTPase ObgE [Candidatus Delongbacteria bacterium]MBN2835895.1 GTPase ObgE [Candidatus Delongbacteria bacterium]